MRLPDIKKLWLDLHGHTLEFDSPWESSGHSFLHFFFRQLPFTLNFHQPLSLVMCRSTSIKRYIAHSVRIFLGTVTTAHNSNLKPGDRALLTVVGQVACG